MPCVPPWMSQYDDDVGGAEWLVALPMLDVAPSPPSPSPSHSPSYLSPSPRGPSVMVPLGCDGRPLQRTTQPPTSAPQPEPNTPRLPRQKPCATGRTRLDFPYEEVPENLRAALEPHVQLSRSAKQTYKLVSPQPGSKCKEGGGFQVQVHVGHGKLVRCGTVGDERVGALMVAACRLDPRLAQEGLGAVRWIMSLMDDPAAVKAWLNDVGMI